MSFPSILQPGMLGGQNKWMPCLCFQSIFTSQNRSKTQQASFLEKYHMRPVDCKLHKLFVACRLQVQGSQQADTRRRLSRSGQFICLQTVPTRRSGKEERMVGMTRWGRLQGCRLSSPAPGSGVMLDTIGFEPPWKSVSWRCWQTVQKGGLYARQVMLFKGCLFGFLAAAECPYPSKMSVAVLSISTRATFSPWCTSSWETNQVQCNLLNLNKGYWGCLDYRKAEYIFSLFMDI